MAKLLDIITNPNPILRKQSEKIDLNTIQETSFQQLLADMTKTMKEKDGIGLAAPQIGKNIRLIVVTIDNEVQVMINPQITKRSWAKISDEEGCLSIPQTFSQVERHKKISLNFRNFDGKLQKVNLSHLNARVVQHEIDHLDGILFIDKATHIKKVND